MISGFVTVFLAFLFAFSSFAKWMDMEGFKETIAELGLSRRLQGAAVRVVPLLELAAAALLLWERTQAAGCLLLLLLSAGFIWSLWRARGQGIECNCFGRAIPEEFGSLTAVRIAVCILLAVYLLVMPLQGGLFSLAAEEILWMFLLSCGILAAYTLFSVIAKYRRMGLTHS